MFGQCELEEIMKRELERSLVETGELDRPEEAPETKVETENEDEFKEGEEMERMIVEAGDELPVNWKQIHNLMTAV